MVETERARLKDRIDVAKSAMTDRARELAVATDAQSELDALADALRGIESPGKGDQSLTQIKSTDTAPRGPQSTLITLGSGCGSRILHGTEMKCRTECGFSCELWVAELGGCAVNCLRHHILFLI